MTIDKPMKIKLDTANGAIQIIGLPHVTRHQLMTIEKYANFLLRYRQDFNRAYFRLAQRLLCRP